MLLDPNHTQFLKPALLMYELLVLQELQKPGFLLSSRGTGSALSDLMAQGYLERFAAEGWTETVREQSGQVVRLTTAGEQRLGYLLVDYVRELIALYGFAREVFHKHLVEFYLAGVRRVAFYPVGETSEVVYLALQDSGLSLVMAVDDDPARWDTPFHEVTIRPPQALSGANVDGVIVTTSVFQSEVIDHLSALDLAGLRVLLLTGHSWSKSS